MIEPTLLLKPKILPPPRGRNDTQRAIRKSFNLSKQSGTRLDRIEAATMRMAPLPRALSPQQVAVLALQDELAVLRRRLVISDGGRGI